ncbi:hypothetical protein HYPSUDRAFT_40371 [Hypholoma sublateritium FD-334 SS-4]|uniref:Uncharacterized protein n=1 Tax=Hypholoma sublateritium (strain FD-334 SS-4) TaxID=945553 RepID=A0A0D2L745_HYPSF|nr:hypothetical protein HYPSUDRAFT_40371 [Hypholoma sublateritium FD-334 SS-4]
MERSSNAFDLLESALDQAFSVPPPREAPPAEVEPVAETTASTASLEESLQPVETSTDSLEDSWKAQYEAQVQNWRSQSAEAREKAEKERLKWEAIRAIEREEAAKRRAAGIVDDPPPIVSGTKSEIWDSVEEFSITTGSTSFTGAVQSETFEQPTLTVPDENPSSVLPRTDSQLEHESQKWEDVPSVTSSYPSLSFPEHSESPPSKSQPAPPQAPVSVTLAIFDPSLSRQTRLTAFFSSLAINLFLPFVNGVMLGFGEIFAKNIVMQWFGWKPTGPASTVTNVGLRGTRKERQRQSR